MIDANTLDQEKEYKKFREKEAAEYQAQEAKRILEEVEPYLIKIEQLAIEDMVRIPTGKPDADELRRCLAERIRVTRDLRAILQTQIRAGKLRQTIEIP
jgi:hypothetical protein